MAQFYISAFADEAGKELEQQIAALQRNGVRFVELRNVGEGGLIAKSDEELKDIADRLHAAGITVSSLGSPIGKFDIDGDFEVHLADFRRALRACELLGTKKMRMFSFFVERSRLAECREEVLRRMNILLDEAEAAGIQLCHENETKIYGQNPAEVKDLLTSLPRLGGIFDAANYVMNDCDPIEGIAVTLPSLAYLHVKDMVSADKCMVPVGMGDGKYAEVLKTVDAHTDQTLFLTVEPHLHIFDAYAKIDTHELHVGVKFDNSDDAFDCAVTSLKNLLTSLGYHEEENKLWKK